MKKKTKDTIYLVAALATIATLVYEFALKPLYHLHRASITGEISAVVGQKLVDTNSQLASIQTRLGKIEEDFGFLDPLIHQAVENWFKKLATMRQSEFQKHLPVLATTVQAARVRKVSTAPSLLTPISLKLSKISDKDTKYWSTTASFLTYRSENTQPSLALKFAASPENVPRCTDTQPKPYEVLSVPSPTKVTLRAENYEDCRIQLDDPQDISRLNDLLVHNFRGGVGFVHCLIVYRGGEIPLLLFKNARPDSPPISSLFFKDCIYDFLVAGTPSPQGQKTLEIILLNTNGDILVPPGSTIQVVPKPPSK